MEADVAEVKAIWADVEDEVDKAKATKMFEQMNQLGYDRAMFLPLYAYNMEWAYNKADIGELEIIGHQLLTYIRYWDFRGKYPADRTVEWETVE